MLYKRKLICRHVLMSPPPTNPRACSTKWLDRVAAATGAVYFTIEACSAAPWADATSAFQRAFDSLKGMTRASIMAILWPNLDHRTDKAGNASAPRRYVLMKRAVVTPSRVILMQPATVQSSRLIRRFPERRFLIVHFRDEQGQRLRGTREAIPHLRRVLRDGLVIGGTQFGFLACSGSQLRSQAAIFVAGGDEGETQRLRDLVVKNLGEFKSVAKYSARLGLYLTTDTPTIDIAPSSAICVDDLKADDGALVTDGAGKLSWECAERVSKLMGLATVPAAFQFRWAGLKGTW